MNEPMIKFENVSKKYNLYKRNTEKLLNLFLINKRDRSFYALRNVTFDFHAGETIGIVGINGSGKSTLSNLLAQIIPQTSGEITINGETSLIAISAGLNNNLTGMENIEMKCLMLGLTKSEIKAITPSIVEFSDIGNFINQPVKNYSSGMRSRLGFAISVHTNPEILIVDEALSVGDQTFYDKCIDKINEFKNSGKTIIFISHSVPQIRSISDKVLWLHYGEVKEFGEVSPVLAKYKEFIKWYNELTDNEKKQYRYEMLSTQNKKNENEMYHNNGKKSEKKLSDIIFSLQFLVLFLITIISAVFLFLDTPSALLSKEKKHTSKSNEEQTVEVVHSIGSDKEEQKGIIIKKNGITTGETFVYFDKDMNFEMEKLPFATSVFVEEQLENKYKIKYNERTAYIEDYNIQLIVENNNTSDILLEDLIPFFPEAFSNSYEYYLTFIGKEYEEIEDTFVGARKNIDIYGQNQIEYEYGSFTFKFDQHKNKANTIIIDNVDFQQGQLQEVIQYAKIKDEDAGLYFFESINFRVILDIKQNTIEMKSIG